MPQFPLMSGVMGLLGPVLRPEFWEQCRNLAQQRPGTRSSTSPRWGQGLRHWGGQGADGHLRAGSTLSPANIPHSASLQPSRSPAARREQDRMRTRSWEPSVGKGAGGAGGRARLCPGAAAAVPAPGPLAAGRGPWRRIRPSVHRDQCWTAEPRSALGGPSEEGPAAPSPAGGF